MFYCIDFDSRQVESKSESRELLDKYVADNDLELAVAIIESEEELCLQFSLGEMADLASNIGISNVSGDEEDLASRILDALKERAEEFPDFTSKLGKKLSSSSEPKQKPQAKGKAAPKEKSAPKQSSGGSRTKLDLEAPLFVVDGKCKSGSILATIVTAIEDELCATVGEVRDYILANHRTGTGNFPVDEKYADHNIRYFLKQGKISHEEQL